MPGPVRTAALPGCPCAPGHTAFEVARNRPRVRSREIMSSQPHTVLPWVVRRTRQPLLSLRCAGCRSESATTGEGRFRVNANGKLLDVWLLARCLSCDRTSKLTVHSERRSDPSSRPSSTATSPTIRNWWRPGCWIRCSPGAAASSWTGRGLAAGHPAGMARRGVAGPGGGRLRRSGTGAPGTAHRARAGPQQERGTAPGQVRHSAAPSGERRVHLYRDGRGLAGM
jgi:hypothetical protein